MNTQECADLEKELVMQEKAIEKSEKARKLKKELDKALVECPATIMSPEDMEAIKSKLKTYKDLVKHRTRVSEAIGGIETDYSITVGVTGCLRPFANYNNIEKKICERLRKGVLVELHEELIRINKEIAEL